MDAIVSRLKEMIEPEHVTTESSAGVQGVRAPVEVRPADAEQLGWVLALAHEERLGVAVIGGGTKAGWGNRPGRLDLLVSTRGLRGFSHVDADNLSLSVRAGTTVAEARAQAQAISRVLPLDPCRPTAATVGGVVATGDQGARGAGYGGLRDVVLGLSAVLADGSAVKFGGRTMKNVSGYDMTKLFVSSFGVLGVITDVTFRLLPRYETQALMILPMESLDRTREVVAQILDSHLEPLALEVVSSGFFARAGLEAVVSAGLAADGVGPTGGDSALRGEPVMLAGFAGQPAAVARSVAEVRDRYSLRPHAVLEGSAAESLYEALADPGAQGGPAREPLVWARVTCPISRVWELARSADSGAGAHGLELDYRIGAARGTLDLFLHRGQDAAQGTAEAGLSALLGGLRRDAEAAGGALTIRDGLPMLAPDFDAWGEVGSSLKIMRRIKERFDPHRVLNPGRFVGGI